MMDLRKAFSFFVIFWAYLCAMVLVAQAQCTDVQWVYGQAGVYRFALFDGADMNITCSTISGTEIQVNFDGTDDSLDTTTVTDLGLECQIEISSEEASPTNLEQTTLTFKDAGTDFDDFCVNLNVRLTAPTSTLQSATSTTAVLAASESYADDLLNGNSEICIVSGTGAQQCRCITDTVQSTDTVTVRRSWTTTPDSTSTYFIRGNPVCAGVPAYELETQAKADVEAEVDEGWAEGTTELSSCPASTADRSSQLRYLYQYLKFKKTETESEELSFKSDDSTELCSRALSDDDTTLTVGAAAAP